MQSGSKMCSMIWMGNREYTVTMAVCDCRSSVVMIHYLRHYQNQFGMDAHGACSYECICTYLLWCFYFESIMVSHRHKHSKQYCKYKSRIQRAVNVCSIENNMSGIQINITLEWIQEGLADGKSISVEVMACCHQTQKWDKSPVLIMIPIWH